MLTGLDAAFQNVFPNWMGKVTKWQQTLYLTLYLMVLIQWTMFGTLALTLAFQFIFFP